MIGQKIKLLDARQYTKHLMSLGAQVTYVNVSFEGFKDYKNPKNRNTVFLLKEEVEGLLKKRRKYK